MEDEAIFPNLDPLKDLYLIELCGDSHHHDGLVWFSWLLMHINHCWLFTAKSLYIYIYRYYSVQLNQSWSEEVLLYFSSCFWFISETKNRMEINL